MTPQRIDFRKYYALQGRRATAPVHRDRGPVDHAIAAGRALHPHAAPAGAVVKVADLQPGVNLRQHQQDFVTASDDTDGIIAVHGLGTGKTLSSIAAVEKGKRPATVFVPAALRGNYRKDLDKFVGNAGDRYQIRSYDAAAKGNYDRRPLMIADEVQRLRNQGTAYQGVMAAARKADKRILLSGTPMVNSPGDLASVINLLHGKQLFGPEEFEKRYAGQRITRPFLGMFGRPRVEPTVEHKDELVKLLKDRVHFVGDVTETKPRVQVNDVPVEMGKQQDALNRGMQGQLPFWARMAIKRNLPPEKRQARQLNAFMSGMRQVGLSPYGFDRRMDAYQAFQASPKLTRSFDTLRQELRNPNGKVMVYSNFIEAGLLPYAAALKRHNVPYAMFYGGMNDAEKKQAVDAYNNGHSRVVLVGPAGSEGISLKGTTRLQMLDPHWNLARTDQAQGRAVRLDSHTHLPLEDRNVTVDRYLSEPRRGVLRRLMGRPPAVGSDLYLHTRATEKQRQLDAFTDLLKEVGTRG
jgi:SNF2 family DNA or RNA helicase